MKKLNVTLTCTKNKKKDLRKVVLNGTLTETPRALHKCRLTFKNGKVFQTSVIVETQRTNTGWKITTDHGSQYTVTLN